MVELTPERYLSESVRERIEQAYYARINEQARLENMIHDPNFLENAAKNPAFFSDHGVVHVRDVARQILRILQTINGVLIPRRTEQQMQAFLYGYGVALAYLHDIGMTDLSHFGRSMHPEFAAQCLFDGSLECEIETMWDDNCGNIAWHLSRLTKAGALKRDPQIIFRELLAMSFCHSKSKIPVDLLDDPAGLRAQMQAILCNNLRCLFGRQQIARGRPLPAGFSFNEDRPDYVGRFYSNFEAEAFDWMTDECESARQLFADVTDTLRALRCADALRQRGTVEKTSGGYEVYASQKTGDCIIALRLGGKRLFLMELPNNPDGAGEANIASSEFNREGNLRISFHRGSFETQAAQNRSATSTAYVINDFLGDTVGSFWHPRPIPGIKGSHEILVQLESTDDDPRFVDLVSEQLCLLSPYIRDQIEIVPSLRNVSELERDRYLSAIDLNWEVEQIQALLERVNQTGQILKDFDPLLGFKFVRIAVLQSGNKLIESGAPSSFVYIPLGDGLRVTPLGGYQSVYASVGMPLGTTGVIRGDVRNADIVAEQECSVLIIPKEVYLKYWYVPYSPDELGKILVEGGQPA